MELGQKIVDHILAQEEIHIKKEGFPIGDTVEDVLTEKGIEYRLIPTKRQFDVRVSKSYDIKLPTQKAKGVKNLFSRYVPTITLKEITDEITERYFSRFEPQTPPESRGTIFVENKFAKYIVNSPKDKATDYGFIDCVDIRVV